MRMKDGGGSRVEGKREEVGLKEREEEGGEIFILNEIHIN